MAKRSPLTIIDNSTLRGVLAPARAVSKRVLEDMIDFLELSGRKSARETTKLIKEADKKKSWVSLKEIRTLARKKR